jgi:hypothetical protein
MVSVLVWCDDGQEVPEKAIGGWAPSASCPGATVLVVGDEEPGTR